MKNLLLVDDSKMFLRVLERILSPKFKIVAMAHNGEEGFQKFTECRPNLVLLDITMPEVNGKDCLKRILAHDPNARVIMVSSLGDDATIQECLRIGAKGFVRKDAISLSDLTAPGLLEATIASALESQMAEAV